MLDHKTRVAKAYDSKTPLDRAKHGCLRRRKGLINSNRPWRSSIGCRKSIAAAPRASTYSPFRNSIRSFGFGVFFLSLLSFSLISLIADGPHHYHPACGHTKDLPISPRCTPYDFFSRCKFSTLTTRQPMVEFYLLTFPRFPLRKKEHKSYFGKNRIHDFHTSRCAGYLLDHSGDEWC